MVKIICRCVVTESMGSCDCGDCCCLVYEDGSIEYTGRYLWQCSERIRKPVFPQPRRDYGSQLTKEQYEEAMRSIKLERSQMLDGLDLLQEKHDLELKLDIVNSRLRRLKSQ